MAPHDPADAMTLWTAVILIVVVVIAWALAGCTPNPCVKPVVTLEEPVLPTVSATAMGCLDQATWDRLWERDLILQSKLRECREVVLELTEQP
jgi:hypothetical protein